LRVRSGDHDRILPLSRSRFTSTLDWLALLLVLAGLAIALTGGFTFRVAGSRVTARSADRALLGAVVLIALRVALDRRTRPLANAPALGRRLRDRLYDGGRDAVTPVRGRTAWRRLGLASAGFSAFGAVLLLPQLRHMDSVPDLGDPLFSMWRIGWVFQKLLGDPRPLFSPNVFYPHELTLTYSDSMLIPALTTAPLLAVGIHPVLAYNVVMVCSFVASAIALYVLAERLTGSAPAAFIAALLFGFHPYRFEHYSHFELQMTYCMPLALLALQQFVATARLRDALLAGVLSVGQLYCSMYYAVFFTFFAGVVFLLTCWLTRAPVRRLLGPAALAAVLALALAWPLAATYRAARLGDREAATVEYYSATTADYFRAHPRSATWGDRTLPGRLPERALFPGVLILLLAGIALVPPVGATRAVYAGALLAIFEISRGFNGPIYPYLYEWLPFVRGLRVPARASILVGLALAVLAGFGVRRLIANRSPVATRLALAALVIAIGIDLRPRLRLEPVWPEPPPIYGSVTGSNAVLAEFPFGGNHAGFTWNVPFMYFSLWHWTDIINGYSGHYPPGQLEFEVELKAFPDPPTLALLRARGATHVTVNCALYRAGCDTLLERLDALPDFRLVTSSKWRGHPARLYELRP
jgi:hypothetical protein